MNATLTSSSGKTHLFSPVIRLGRAGDNQVVINDPKVSPYHAQIHLERQGYSITDLGSNHGTYINEQLLRPNAPFLLNAGDIIRLGETRFRYETSGITQVSNSTNGNGASAWGNTMYTSSPMAVAPSPSNGSPHTPRYQSPVSMPPTEYIRPVSSVRVSAPYPTYTPASLLRKENRRTLWIALGITALVVLVSLLIFASLHSPTRTLDMYCNALKSGDYQTAYNQFAPELGAETNFANYSNTRIVSCSSSSLNVSGNTTTVTITMITASGQTNVAEYGLIQDSSFDWKIYTFQSLSN